MQPPQRRPSSSSPNSFAGGLMTEPWVILIGTIVTLLLVRFMSKSALR
jgi:hypothetical protein